MVELIVIEPQIAGIREMRFRAKSVVSLGAWCQASFQIQRFFGSSAASPYDWLVTPFDALITSINDKGRNFSQDIYVRDGMFPVCRGYGALYHHEFEKVNDRPIINEEALALCKSKLVHKFDRFSDTMAGGDVLLVRMGGHAKPAEAWPYICDPVPFTSGDINSLTEVIDRTFSNPNFRLLIVNLEGRTRVDFDGPVDDRVILRTIPAVAERSDWKGSNEAWDSIFNETKAALV